MEKLNRFTKIFKKIYYEVFIENLRVNWFKFSKKYYRWDLLKYLIDKYEYSYLEIDDQNQLFSKVQIQNKIGVDPVTRKTSDIFQNNDKNLTLFLLILHTYNQVKRYIESVDFKMILNYFSTWLHAR